MWYRSLYGDTGVGCAAGSTARLRGVPASRTGIDGKDRGTGGLTLTKKFVELHGGTVWVESSRPRQPFTFTLPIDATSKPTSLATVLEEATQQQPAVASCTGAMVLVIEDDPKSVDLLRIYLTEAGYAVEVAQDGAEGLEKVKRLAPDVVILDVLLPR